MEIKWDDALIQFIGTLFFNYLLFIFNQSKLLWRKFTYGKIKI